MSDKHWTANKDDNSIVWLKLDKTDGGANVLSGPVLLELNENLNALEADLPKGLVVYSGKSNGFIMGADIKEFTKIENSDQGYELARLAQKALDRLEQLHCPTVAVINGFALGGGLELAIACDYRIALDSEKRILGFPEVQLGIHPGFGGTVRAVRIAGVRPAMQMMLTGNPINVSKGRRIGLIDKVVDETSWRDAANKLVSTAPPKREAPFVERVLSSAIARPFIRNVLLKQVRSKARKEHYPAPYAIIDLWSRFGAKGDVAYQAEARSLAELMCTDTSRNLVRVFFLQNKLKGQGSKDAPKVRHVHVVGAGVMGGDIASWCAYRGLTVTLQDRELKYVEPALNRAQRLFTKRVRDDHKRAETVSRLTADVNGDGAAQADLIIEAIFEDLDAKQSLYKDLQAKMKPGALLATNTSSIRLEELRKVLDAPQRFIGLHFFNPVSQLPLVEVIRCDDTQQEALDIGFGFVKKISKLPLECASSPGFVVNRILAPYTNEALMLAEEGVALPEIDNAAETFGMPMGPIELVDSVGIDVAMHVAKVLGAAMNRPVPAQLEKLVEAGHFGRKSGQGFYQWVDGKSVKPPSDGQVPADIEDRLILPMLNEAVACLAEGVISDAELLDAGVIFGTGFAPFRGGPLQYARSRGIAAVVERLRALTASYGERFTPHPGWSEL
ncbi:MAG: 3-hydroxyacyl-CoA dehydrogenase NAD-binding domain-containing protein [Gammaproteobacteria bacterium]|nr:3-hydroxyacyl-CoA dehydrogenase NAD-binding domain-containing protein [Gammaproteobacteria bacterium]